MELNDKQKMLGFALKQRGVGREAMLNILYLLDTDDELEDMSWFMGQNPNATEEQLVAVAFQLDKESREKRLK
ncbi:MAG: hypothetical protein ACI4MH_02885 [Candidatus Coproplasma sp.]